MADKLNDFSIRGERLSKEEIYKLLLRFDSFFVPPFSHAVDLLQYAEKLYENASFVCCWYNNEEIVGVLVYYKNDSKKQLYIPYICVSGNMQSSGIGTKMINYLIAKEQASFNSILLEVLNTNVRGMAFYRREGFSIVEEHGEKYLLRKVFGKE